MPVDEGVPVWLLLPVPVSVADELGVPVALADMDAVSLLVADTVPVEVALVDSVPVSDEVVEAVAVALELGAPVCEPVPLRLGVPLKLGAPVCEPVLLRVAVGDGNSDNEQHAKLSAAPFVSESRPDARFMCRWPAVMERFKVGSHGPAIAPTKPSGHAQPDVRVASGCSLYAPNAMK